MQWRSLESHLAEQQSTAGGEVMKCEMRIEILTNYFPTNQNAKLEKE